MLVPISVPMKYPYPPDGYGYLCAQCQKYPWVCPMGTWVSMYEWVHIHAQMYVYACLCTHRSGRVSVGCKGSIRVLILTKGESDRMMVMAMEMASALLHCCGMDEDRGRGGGWGQQHYCCCPLLYCPEEGEKGEGGKGRGRGQQCHCCAALLYHPKVGDSEDKKEEGGRGRGQQCHHCCCQTSKVIFITYL